MCIKTYMIILMYACMPEINHWLLWDQKNFWVVWHSKWLSTGHYSPAWLPTWIRLVGMTWPPNLQGHSQGASNTLNWKTVSRLPTEQQNVLKPKFSFSLLNSPTKNDKRSWQIICNWQFTGSAFNIKSVMLFTSVHGIHHIAKNPTKTEVKPNIF